MHKGLSLLAQAKAVGRIKSINRALGITRFHFPKEDPLVKTTFPFQEFVPLPTCMGSISTFLPFLFHIPIIITIHTSFEGLTAA
jgi:hypothetical protein